MPMMSIPRSRPRPDDAPVEEPPSQRLKLEDESSAAISLGASQCSLNASSTATGSPTVPATGRATAGITRPLKLARLPDLRRIDHVPWHWHIETLDTQPPLRIARLPRESHGVDEFDAVPTDGLFESLAIANWERGLSAQGMRQLAFLEVARERFELINAGVFEGETEADCAEALNEFMFDLVEGGRGGQLAMWALEEALGISIIVLRETGERSPGYEYDVVCSRPSDSIPSTRLAHEDRDPWVGLWESAEGTWDLVLA